MDLHTQVFLPKVIDNERATASGLKKHKVSSVLLRVEIATTQRHYSAKETANFYQRVSFKLK